MTLDFGSAGSAFGAAVGDLFGAAGAGEAAAGYEGASKSELLAARLSTASGVIQKAAADRSINRAIGGQRADIGASGFKFSGSGIDLARNSAQQGAISKALIEDQSQIETLGHEEQSAMYASQAQQARTQQSAGLFSGILNIGLGVLGLFSDAALKENIKRIAVDKDGKNVYEFNYIGDNRKWRGYIAQELDPKDVTDAVGFLMPDEKHRAELV